MAAQPDFLLVFNEVSGSTVTNYGTAASGYTVANSGFTWTQNNGFWTNSGYLQGTSNVSTMPSLTSAATGPGTALDSINCAIAFRMLGSSLDNNSAKLVMPSTSTSDGNILVTCDTNGAGFDLNIGFRHTGGAGTTPITFTGLAYNTNYQLACALDMTTVSAALPRAKLNAGTAANGTSANFTSFGFENAWPRLLHRSDFETGAFSFNGRIYYLGYERTSTPWSLADLDAINANPVTAFTGWPGGGGGGSNIGAIQAYRRMMGMM